MVKALWRFLASVNLSIYLLFLIALNLTIGAYYIKFYPDIFRPLNQMLFQEWFKIFGDGKTWWIFSLFFLLIFLGINTGACTLERLTGLWPKRRGSAFGQFFLKLSPSLMHIFFLIALSGHALSVFTGSQKVIPIKAGDIIPVVFGTMGVKEVRPTFWNNPLLKNPLRQCAVALELKTASQIYSKEIRFLHPCWFQDWSLHLDVDQKSKEQLPLRIIIKKDPGSRLILLGGAFMSVLMLWYFSQLNTNNKKD